MTIAQEIKGLQVSFAEALEKADKIAVDADQDWENHTTIFQFSDGSQLKAKFPDLTVL